MYKIGIFSRLSRVPVKTLRYYDEAGLFKPELVDRLTGYRYYTTSQLSRLYRILAYKDLGFSLEQIGVLLKEDLPPQQIRGMLRMRQAEIQQNVSEEQARLKRVEARLRQIEQEDQMPEHEVVIKKVEPLLVASVRGTMNGFGEQAPLWNELGAWLKEQDVRPTDTCLTIYHDDQPNPEKVDMEVCEPIEHRMPESGRVKVRSLEYVEHMACIVQIGSYDQFPQTYDAIIQWIGENGYRICGPNRELYLRNIEHTRNPDEFVAEVQFPVEKI
jgi:DNA-binding transcriptional MerR regulator